MLTFGDVFPKRFAQTRLFLHDFTKLLPRQLQECSERIRRDRFHQTDETFPERADLPDLLADEARQKGRRHERLQRLVRRDGLDNL